MVPDVLSPHACDEIDGLWIDVFDYPSSVIKLWLPGKLPISLVVSQSRAEADSATASVCPSCDSNAGKRSSIFLQSASLLTPAWI